MSESYRTWAENLFNNDRPLISDEELNELWQWTARHGSGNCWAGQSGRIASLVRYLMADRERLRRSLSELLANEESTTGRCSEVPAESASPESRRSEPEADARHGGTCDTKI